MSLGVQALRSPKEPPLFAIGVALSAIAWLTLAITIVGLLYGALILAFILVAHALLLARIRGNSVRLSERQLPGLYARITAGAHKLGMPKVPEVYVPRR